MVIFERNEKLNATKYLRKVLIPIVRDIKSRTSITDNLTTTKLFDDINNWTFQQDGATSHTAKNVQKWLQENVPNYVAKEEWPGNSPDLNVIENLWAYMETKLYENGSFNNMDDLIAKINEVWQNIPLRTLEALTKSMKTRLQHVQQAPDRKAPY